VSFGVAPSFVVSANEVALRFCFVDLASGAQLGGDQVGRQPQNCNSDETPA
jgi:hypothetical protein